MSIEVFNTTFDYNQSVDLNISNSYLKQYVSSLTIAEYAGTSRLQLVPRNGVAQYQGTSYYQAWIVFEHWWL